jgi:uncharacterized membrane protein
MSLELAVMVYPHIADADHAFADAYEADKEAVWLGEAAVVEHHRHDEIAVRGNVGGQWVDAEDEGDVIGKKTLEGALTGGVVGLVFGPAGLAAGLAIGGMAGGEAEAHSAPHVHGAFIDEVRADVPQKHSAIVLLAAPEHVDQMAATLADGKRRGELTRRQLSDEMVGSLREALAGSRPAG